MSWKRVATRLENELANLLWDRGYAVVRGPSSGSGARRRFQPDLIAARDGVILIIEVKRGHPGRPIYIPPRQVEGLLELEKRSGGRAVVAVKVPWEEWRFHLLSELPRTQGGRAKIEDPLRGLRLLELEEILFSRSRKLTEYFGEGGG